jgi:DNA-binding transcriptional LysR family regulator
MREDFGMNIEALRLFLAIYKGGSVSRAAESLGVSQSGASTALARLRQHFNDELFIKTAHGMKPTVKSVSLSVIVKALIQSADELEACERIFDPYSSTDEFRIVAGDILEGPVMWNLAARMAKLAPDAKIVSLSARETDLEEMLASGEIDVYLGSFDDFGSGVQRSTIAEYAFGCFCRVSHPLANKALSREEFEVARFAILHADSSIPNVATNWLQKHRIRQNVAVQCAHFHAIPNLIKHCDLLAIVPTDLGGTWLFGGDVARVHLPFDLPRPTINIYWHRIYQTDPRNVWIRGLVADGLRGMTRNLRRSWNNGTDDRWQTAPRSEASDPVPSG